ncbi:MAG: GNAT family N-acetyltransferase [Chloroflexi bacterium]|nr:GNAT family N-acetyltransferase [Chloroflexota bacterium]OJW04397.1 MAG: hypothetical protein BGO39_11630 [Chloroflexi bacterium 54-19]
MLEIAPFDFEKHFARTFELWQASFEKSWPLDEPAFRRLISDDPYIPGLRKRQFVALVEGVVAGFVLFQFVAEKGSGNLNLVMVAPGHQRQGVGTALHNYALAELQKAGAVRVQLGGGSPTFWQGIPDDLSGAANFFEKMGWQYSETSYDLTQNLQGFTGAGEFSAPVATRGITFRTAVPADQAAIVAFEKAEFPNWLGAYEYVMGFGDFNDLLLVCDIDGKIVGTVIMFSPLSNPYRLDVPWKRLLGENRGALGCVGIARSLHRQGLGSAMMAAAMEELKKRGVGNCHIGWTWRVTFYEKLGFKLWKSFWMSWQNFS